ncbi:GntR family transcriptional regulator [Arcanobacterium canis]|uniref:GntR family transcriptional regulator n=1 Tax=Arcanobacterium canis TaxID=999183 RepID=A0ABY8FXZ3_9ACTO|nr:GntR family transcriptional regulator [Arcanobacterium canis]WFM83376.1 GntR family transcriptional regulator [Arcanobacterium canis]
MSFDDSRPIWVQLAENFGQKIISGQWKPGTKIPSVRELALAEGANPNTIQRALGKLDDEALTVTERAHGRFVTTDVDIINRARRHAAQTQTDKHVAALRGLGLSLDVAWELLQQRWDTSD